MTESHTEEPSVVSSSVDVGQRLRDAREAKKISITDAAAQLRVTRDAIVHLEEQNWDRLHGRTYARGYFLSYAKFLGLPQDEMLAGFNIEFTETHHRSPSIAPIQQLKPAKSGLPWLSLILLIMVAVLAWFAYQQWQATQVEQISEVPDQPLIEPVDEPEAANISNSIPITDSNDESVISSDQVELNDESVIGSETPQSELPVEAEQTESLSEPATDQQVPIENEAVVSEDVEPVIEEENQSNLVIGIDADCWVEVRDANQQVLISRVVRAGNTVELTGATPLQVSLGQANAATVRFEGKMIDISEYTRGNVARFTVGADS